MTETPKHNRTAIEASEAVALANTIHTNEAIQFEINKKMHERLSALETAETKHVEAMSKLLSANVELLSKIRALETAELDIRKHLMANARRLNKIDDKSFYVDGKPNPEFEPPAPTAEQGEWALSTPIYDTVFVRAPKEGGDK